MTINENHQDFWVKEPVCKMLLKSIWTFGPYRGHNIFIRYRYETEVIARLLIQLYLEMNIYLYVLLSVENLCPDVG